MDITYEIDVNNVTDFNIYTLDHLPYGKKIITNARLSYILVAALSLIIGLILFFSDEWFSVYFFIMSLAIIAGMFFIKSQYKNNLVKRVKKLYGSNIGKNSYIGKHSLSITPETIKDIHESSESTVRWDIIYGIGTTNDNIFIVLNPSTSAFIVPRKAFADEASFTLFAETAKQYHQAALANAKAD
jgi:hypothetical protein